jgi:proline dehydrogenase
VSVLRPVLLALSHNRSLQSATRRIPVVRRMARRFVAGETLQDAIGAVLALNRQGFVATLDYLGENVTTREEATGAADEYLAALDTLYLANADSNVSVKLSQMGLDLDEDFCCANMERILYKAAERSNFIRIDMEGSAYVERTINLYRRLRQRHDNVGLAVQSYLHRSRRDVEELIALGYGHFRLVKGAYDEPPEIAYQEREVITRALNELIGICMGPRALERGAYCAVASHDQEVINFARAYAYGHGVPSSRYEFQMLYGIRRELQNQLLRKGYKVRIYVPYGSQWYPYFMRRLAERPANLLFFLRAMVGD